LRRKNVKCLKAVVAGATLAIAASASAQQPNPMDNVPDKMPNDIPYGAPISLERAQAAINAAVAESKKRGWKLNEHKARAAAKFRRETKAFEAGVQAGNNYLLTLDDVIASRGGIPVLQNGQIIGAIGCSGGTGSQDEVVCKAGAEAVK
jgi:uncharacterized protein GlcG (DUF336 family)